LRGRDRGSAGEAAAAKTSFPAGFWSTTAATEPLDPSGAPDFRSASTDAEPSGPLPTLGFPRGFWTGAHEATETTGQKTSGQQTAGPLARADGPNTKTREISELGWTPPRDVMPKLEKILGLLSSNTTWKNFVRFVAPSVRTSADKHTKKHTKKQVRVYIESGCPDSREFVLYSLAYALKPEQGLAPLINVSLIAWGNAYHNGVGDCGDTDEYTRDGSRCWQKACKNGTQHSHCFDSTKSIVHQHGEKEGEVDRLINCAMLHTRGPWPYVQCLLTDYEKAENAAALAASCKENTADIYGDEKKTIATAEACARSDEGKSLLMQAAQSTPKHPGVPYVTIDGEAVDSEKFIEELCKRVDAKQVPPACVSKSSASASSAPAAQQTSVSEVTEAAVFKHGKRGRHHHKQK
jgi:hypothetical protein